VTAPHTLTAARDAVERREAARALLQQPIVTSATDPVTVAAARRHAPALTAMFAERLGYRLVVGPTFARLEKAPLDPASPPRGARHADGDHFGPTTYACLALACAALLVPGTGDEVSAARLREQVRVDAADLGIPLGGEASARRDLDAALQLLEEWGVLTGSGSPEGTSGPTFTVHRDLLPHLTTVHLPPAPHTHPTPQPVPAAVRLYRRLVEDPFVSRSELDAETAEVLVRDRHELARRLEEDFGLVLEIRAEGALAYDPDGTLTDEQFPGPGPVQRAALLLVSELAARHTDAGAEPQVDDATADEILAGLTPAPGRLRGTASVRDPASFRRDVTALLVRLNLARPHDGGFTLTAAAARYRPVPPGGSRR